VKQRISTTCQRCYLYTIKSLNMSSIYSQFPIKSSSSFLLMFSLMRFIMSFGDNAMYGIGHSIANAGHRLHFQAQLKYAEVKN
jgi:hypothetical protein